MTVAGAALLAVLAVAWHLNRPEMLAARWQARIANLPDAQIDPELRRIAALGDAGIPILARAIGSPREALQGAARRALLDELTYWELLPSSRAKAKLAILAEAIANAAPDFDPPTRRFAADLAMRILHWPHDDGDGDRPTLLAHCEVVLAAAAGRHGSGRSLEAPIASVESKGNFDPTETLTNLPRLSGGGLPVEMANLPPPRATAPAHDEAGNAATAEPGKLQSQSSAKPLDDSARRERSETLNPSSAANQPRRLANADDHDAATTPVHVATSTSSAGEASAANLANARLREVIEKFDSSDRQIAAAAQAELLRRGIMGPLIDMARRLADRDPAVRLQLAESLPTFSGVDARAWLLELSYDEDPQVRSAAVTLMATSGDIELLKRVQQVALDDPDDHTRAQAEKALPRGKRR